RARDAARPAVPRVAREVDASAVTAREPRVADDAAGAAAAGCATELGARAGSFALAAVARIRREIHAGARTELELSLAADRARSVPAHASPARDARTALAAGPAVRGIGAHVDARAVAPRLPRWAIGDALALDAHLPLATTTSARSAVRAVATQLHAGLAPPPGPWPPPGPAGHAGTHAPSTPTSRAPPRRPHAPQFARSRLSSTQASPQRTVPGSHSIPQTPSAQKARPNAGASQTIPHSPQ